jgi:hypothetical protein
MVLRFYMKDKMLGGEVHSVTANLLSGAVTMNNHESPESEDLMTFMTGQATTCKTFYDLFSGGRPLTACMTKDVYPGIIRIRMLASWLEIFAPYYDNWDGKKKSLDSETLRSMVPCKQIAHTVIRFLEKYNDPSFDVIMESFGIDEEWYEKHEIGAKIGSSIFAMYNSTAYDKPIPREEPKWTPEDARRYYAWCVASIADFLVRAVGWWPGVGRVNASESKEVEEEIRKAFFNVEELLGSQQKYRRAHIATSEEEWDPNAMIIIDLLSAAAKVTKQHTEEL